MFTKLDAFGQIFSPGQPARVSFNDEFVHIEGEPAAFVIEFRLDSDGHRVTFHQAGASQQEGLILHHYQAGTGHRILIRKGQLVQLGQHTDERLCLPGKLPCVCFGVRVDGEVYFTIEWESKGAPPQGVFPAEVLRKLGSGQPLTPHEQRLVDQQPMLAAEAAAQLRRRV